MTSRLEEVKLRAMEHFHLMIGLDRLSLTSIMSKSKTNTVKSGFQWFQ